MFGAQVISPYQQIIEKTKNLTTKANAISLTIDKKMKNVDNVSQIVPETNNNLNILKKKIISLA